MRRLVLCGWVAIALAGCAKSEVPCQGADCAAGAPDAQVPCGNGEVDPGEACDDGHADACGSCNADCTGPGSGATCGDGQHCPELERCDDGYTDACGSCNEACLAVGSGATCGDGVICPELETCDDGYADACGSCNADCTGAGTVSSCGDGVFCPEFEACDDGYTDACGNCNADCTAGGAGAACGDNVICPELETCDVGDDPCHQCAADCTGPGGGAVCGDGDWCQASEQCEDGNTSNGDGCSAQCLDECDPNNDISLSATPTSSGGGVESTGYGPSRMNDGHYEAECGTYRFHWINAGTSPGAGYFQYSWPAAVPVRRIAIDTTPSNICLSSTGRNLRGGTIQYWDGAAWVTAGTVSGQTNDWSFTFPGTVTTSAVRIYGAHSSSTDNPLVFEWDVFSCI